MKRLLSIKNKAINENTYIKGSLLRIVMSPKGSYIRNSRKRGSTNASSTNNLLVKRTNDCTEEDIHLHLRLCAKFSSYFCSHCCDLDQEIIKLLN